MGSSVGRVILPMALAAAAVYTGGLVPTYLVSSAGTSVTGYMFLGNPLSVAAAAGAAGVSEIGAIRRERAQQAAEAARSAHEATRLRDAYEAEERRRRLQLKRWTATLRARFAASGTATGGSAQAVIAGLRKVADDDRRESRRTLDRRLDLLARREAPSDSGKRFLKQALTPAINLLKLPPVDHPTPAA